MSRLNLSLHHLEKTTKTRSKAISRLWLRWLRRLYWRLILMRGKPEYLARGLAVGVFAGCFPFLGLQTLLGVSLAVIFRGHKVLAAAGTWVSNPFTYVPIYLFNYKVGRWLLGSADQTLDLENLQSTQEIFELGAEFAITLLTGCFVIGFLSAILSYVGSVRLIRRWRQERSQQQHKLDSQASHWSRAMIKTHRRSNITEQG